MAEHYSDWLKLEALGTFTKLLQKLSNLFFILRFPQYRSPFIHRAEGRGKIFLILTSKDSIGWWLDGSNSLIVHFF
ncbi:hypothetical protein ACP86_09415 [Marinobacter sp. CP1]|uniref:Uncharacterized protein n=1 Tax=Marinobacter adhaerens TaxID=1033846 RepID=A0A352IPY8_9GAMM|nr:hypothetical protein ACP86_09415 [Marinobacter sp. CP1]HBC33521.1 hypothetical protein [Marinobacter adhaerens]